MHGLLQLVKGVPTKRLWRALSVDCCGPGGVVHILSGDMQVERTDDGFGGCHIHGELGLQEILRIRQGGDI